jgi:hypothetical protein
VAIEAERVALENRSEAEENPLGEVEKQAGARSTSSARLARPIREGAAFWSD